MIDYYGRSRMSDFGLSKHLGNKPPECRTFCGTPEYMSPEVAFFGIEFNISKPLPQFERGFYSYEVDWWALAITIYECFSGGEMPYNEDPDDPLTVSQKAIISPRQFAVRKFSDPNANDLLLKMLKKDFYKRLGPKENIKYFFNSILPLCLKHYQTRQDLCQSDQLRVGISFISIRVLRALSRQKLVNISWLYS